MKNSTIAFIIMGVVVFAFLATSVGGFIMYMSYNNAYATKFNRYKATDQKRFSFYQEAIYMSIAQKGQVALKNDSSFRKNVDIIMSGRKDAESLSMKWIQEQNPNANYAEVSKLYQDLSRCIEANRMEFVSIETQMAGIAEEINNLLDTQPSGFFLTFFGNKQRIDFVPISSSRTDAVKSTNKDDNVNVF